MDSNFRTLEEELYNSSLRMKDQVVVIDDGALFNFSLNYILKNDETKLLRKRRVRKITNNMYFLLPKYGRVRNKD